MNTILAFDTSGSVLTVALQANSCLYTHSAAYGLRHSEYLLPSIERILMQAECSIDDIDLIAATKGPGSFTGLRVSMATAKGLAFGREIPMVFIPTLDVYQHPYSWFEGKVMPVIDARKNRYYTAVYRRGQMESDIYDIPADDLLNLASLHTPVLITGADAQVFLQEAEERSLKLPPDLYVHLQDSAPGGKSLIDSALCRFQTAGGDHPTAGPLYIRKSEAEQNQSAKP